MRENWKWETVWLRGLTQQSLCKGPPSTAALLEFCEVLNTDGEADRAELGMGSRENPLTACSWWQTCSWGQTGFLAAVRGSPNVTFIEWNQSDLIIFWGVDPLICPRASGLGGSSLKVTDRIQVTRIQFSNVSFWYLKKSYLRLKLEDLDSNYDSAIDMLCDLEQVTSLGLSFPATLWRLNESKLCKAFGVSSVLSKWRDW